MQQDDVELLVLQQNNTGCDFSAAGGGKMTICGDIGREV